MRIVVKVYNLCRVKTNRLAVLTVKSGLDPHMINKLIKKTIKLTKNLKITSGGGGGRRLGRDLAAAGAPASASPRARQRRLGTGGPRGRGSGRRGDSGRRGSGRGSGVSI